MIMVRHNGISTKIHRKHIAQFKQLIQNPLTAVLKISAEIMILTAQESATHAARNAVIVGRIVQ
jgi:hypothetical protein